MQPIGRRAIDGMGLALRRSGCEACLRLPATGLGLVELGLKLVAKGDLLVEPKLGLIQLFWQSGLVWYTVQLGCAEFMNGYLHVSGAVSQHLGIGGEPGGSHLRDMGQPVDRYLQVVLSRRI